MMPAAISASWYQSIHILIHFSDLKYHNVSKFSDRQVWANSADPVQTAPGLHCLQFPLHLLDALF